jgi:hypothetical protein
MGTPCAGGPRSVVAVMRRQGLRSLGRDGGRPSMGRRKALPRTVLQGGYL